MQRYRLIVNARCGRGRNGMRRAVVGERTAGRAVYCKFGRDFFLSNSYLNRSIRRLSVVYLVRAVDHSAVCRNIYCIRSGIYRQAVSICAVDVAAQPVFITECAAVSLAAAICCAYGEVCAGFDCRTVICCSAGGSGDGYRRERINCIVVAVFPVAVIKVIAVFIRADIHNGMRGAVHPRACCRADIGLNGVICGIVEIAAGD